MGWESEKVIESYYGKYKKSGLLGKQYTINLFICHSHIEGEHGNQFSTNEINGV